MRKELRMIRFLARCAMALVLVAGCSRDDPTLDMHPTNRDMSLDMATPPDMTVVPPDMTVVADMTVVPPDMTVVPPTFTVPTSCAAATVNLITAYPIINTNCAIVNCHRAGATLPVMGPNDSNLFRTNVVNFSAGRQPASLNYVTPNDLDNSFLAYKITGQQGKVRFGGAQMPNNLPALSANDQCTIINWIRSGAN
jgi:hypothetical protein